MAKQPSIPDIATLIQAGIDPRTRLPIKLGSDNATSKNAIKKIFRIIDEQDAVNRYKWYNLPCNLTSQELERLLYYKGQLAFFYMEDLDEFFFMPYALDGTIDFYGRYNTIHPVPMTSGVEEEGTKKQQSAQAAFLSTLKLNCVYGVKLDEVDEEEMKKSCVLLHDYTKQLSQTIIARQIINDPLLDVMSDCIPFMRTNLLSGTGVKGVRVQDADQEDTVRIGAKSVEGAAQNGQIWVPLIGNVEFQELTDGALSKSEEYFMALQSLDNLRLSSYGLENGGVFEKKAHILNSENEMNSNNVGLVFQDGLSIRQNFCNIVNSIWGLGIWCEPSENEIMTDMDGDGVMYDDDTEGYNSGVDYQGDEQ